jgi:ribosomal protein S18 acetylase RimI-like enzyme
VELFTSRAEHVGQNTLVGSWAALSALSPGAHLRRSHASLAAVFPAWSPLNNAVLLDPPTAYTASNAAVELKGLYANAGVPGWALWLPSQALDFDSPDEVDLIDGMVRDTSTLVMTSELSDGLPFDGQVRRTTVQAAGQAGDEPVAADQLPPPEQVSDLIGWALIDGNYAVASAWTYLHEIDLGIYAVGTVPGLRRRGLAKRLMLHVLADGYQRGARTASLQSTPMGEPLYASLQFRPAGRYDEWVPDE